MKHIVIYTLLLSLLLMGRLAQANAPVDLSVQLSSDAVYQLQSADVVTFTLTYENKRDVAVSNAEITLTLPDEMTLLSTDGDQANLVLLSQNRWRIVTLPAQSKGQLRVHAQVKNLATSRQRLLVTAELIQAEDSQPSDNQATMVLWFAPPPKITVVPTQSQFIGDEVTFSARWESGSADCCTQSQTRTIDVDGLTGEYNDIAIGVDGLPIISYHEFINGSLIVLHCEDLNCQKVMRTELDSDEFFNNGIGRYTSIAIGPDGLPIISYHASASGELRVAHCADIACTQASIAVVDSNGVGEGTSIAIGSDGLPIISYYDPILGDLKVAHCQSADCSRANITTVASTGRVGEYNELALNRDGFPMIAYYDGTNKALRFIACRDYGCQNVEDRVVASQDHVGWYPSLAQGADGLPLIAYYNVTSADLQVAHCADLLCTSAEITTIDATGDSGHHNSLAIGANGLPTIAYHERTNATLKLATCHDLRCQEATITTFDALRLNGEHASLAIDAQGVPVVAYYHSGIMSDLRFARCAGLTQTVAQWAWGDGSVSEMITLKQGETQTMTHRYHTPDLYQVQWKQGATTLSTFHSALAELGDLPVSYLPAWHTKGHLWLGQSIDYEAIAQEDLDESDDGVVFSTMEVVANRPIEAFISVQGDGQVSEGFLQMWVDWDSDGLFNETELMADQPITLGNHKVTFVPPPTYQRSSGLAIRVRLYDYTPSARSAQLGAGGGEVEDYLLRTPTAITFKTQSADFVPLTLFLPLFALLPFTMIALWSQKRSNRVQ